MSSSDVPNGWMAASIDDVATSLGGSTPSKSDPSYWTNGNTPWVSPKDMKTFHICSSEDLVTEKALERLTKIPENSILLVVRSGILARTLPVAINTVTVTINQDMRAFVPEKTVDPRFVAWQLMADEREILSDCSKDGTTVASIEGPALSAYPLKIAPAPEQTRIVEKLEELLSDLDAGVAELEAAQRKLAQYRQSLLKAAVEGALTADWRAARTQSGKPSHSSSPRKRGSSDLASETSKTLDSRLRGNDGKSETGPELLERILTERRARWERKQLAKFAEQGKVPPKYWRAKYPEPVTPDTVGLPTLPDGWVWASVDQLSYSVRNGLSQKPEQEPVGYPILRINAVRPMLVRLDEVRYLRISSEEAQPYLLKNGDLLATRYNGSVDLLGVVGVVRGLSRDTVHPDKLIRIQPVLDQPLADWIEIAASMGASRAHIISRVKTTAGQTGIAGDDLKRMPVPLPPQPEQAELSSIIRRADEAVTAQLQAVDRLLAQAAAQRKNILKAAFAGQLVPQDPNDEPAAVLLERIRAERSTKNAITIAGKRGRKAKDTA